MITIINERNGHKMSFKNYQRLYSHLDSHQRVKRSNKPRQSFNEWIFMHHSYRRTMALYEFVSTQKRNIEKDLVRKKKFDVLEMSHDRSRKPIMISLMPNTDIETHLEDWCRRYCQYHGFKLVEFYEDDGVLHVKKEPADLSDPDITYDGVHELKASE